MEQPTPTPCPNCQRLQKEVDRLLLHVAELTARVAALEAELRRGRRQAAPFSRDKNTAEPKKPGRKPGQGPFERRALPPEEEIETVQVPLDRCPDCGGPLEDRRRHEHVQSDLPPPKPTHTRFVNESAFCPRCGRRFHSRHPTQSSVAAGAAGVSVGPNTQAIAADMHHRLGVPYAKVADHLRAVTGLSVTPGALCQAGARLAHRLAPVYRDLVEAIRGCCAAHVDETGWRVGTLSAWLWVFTSRHVTVYVIDESRGHEVVVNVLGREFKGTLVGDCFLAYDHRAFAGWLKQKCFAHFLKDLSRMEAEKTRGAVRFPREVARVLRDALGLARDKPLLTPRQAARRLGGIQRRLDALIDERRRFTDPDNARFAGRLRKQREHLFTFLMRDGVEPTNNRAERMLRPAVIVRKTGGCNKTQRGAATHGVLASILATAKQNALDGIRYLAGVLTSPGPAPQLPIPTLNSS